MIPNKSAVLHIKESLVCKLVGIDSFAQINIWFVKILGDFGRLKFSMLRIFGFDPNPRPHTPLMNLKSLCIDIHKRASVITHRFYSLRKSSF